MHPLLMHCLSACWEGQKRPSNSWQMGELGPRVGQSSCFEF